MKKLLPFLFATLFTLYGQAQEGREPLPDAPPPPKIMTPEEAAMEPAVTIRKDGQNKVEEYRMNGKLYMVKITPTIGAPYYLIDHDGKGSFTRHNEALPGTTPPQWVILSW